MRVVLFGLVLAVVTGLSDVAFAALSGGSGVHVSAEPLRLAYLDPGSGSIVVQALIAMLAGIVVTSRMYWSKIKTFLGFSSATVDEDEDEDDV